MAENKSDGTCFDCQFLHQYRQGGFTLHVMASVRFIPVTYQMTYSAAKQQQSRDRRCYLSSMLAFIKCCSLHHNRFMALFRDHPGQPVPEENFWTLWCKGRLTEADTPSIRVGATPSGLTSAHLHHPPIFLQARCPSCRPAIIVKALKATSAFRLGRRC